jgi:hypothetical protein
MLDVQSLVKYLLGGTVVSAASYCIKHKPANLEDIGMIAVSSSVAFIVLDLTNSTMKVFLWLEVKLRNLQWPVCDNGYRHVSLPGRLY